MRNALPSPSCSAVSSQRKPAAPTRCTSSVTCSRPGSATTIRPTSAPSSRHACRRCPASGVPVHFIRGNRDFLLGDAYARSAGMTILPDPAVVVLYGKPTLLMHGDLLCTDDVAYQQFRAQTRNPLWQRAVPVAAAGGARWRSRSRRVRPARRTSPGCSKPGRWTPSPTWRCHGRRDLRPLRHRDADPRPYPPASGACARGRHAHRARRLVRTGFGAAGRRARRAAVVLVGAASSRELLILHACC